MPGVQTLIPVMLNHINDGKLSLNQLMNFVCENPVKIFRIKNKGFIKEGYDADFTIVDMNKTIEIKMKILKANVNGRPLMVSNLKGHQLILLLLEKLKCRMEKFWVILMEHL